jgi:hypothetical protein
MKVKGFHPEPKRGEDNHNDAPQEGYDTRRHLHHWRQGAELSPTARPLDNQVEKSSISHETMNKSPTRIEAQSQQKD